MRHPLGIGFALAATATFASAGHNLTSNGNGNGGEKSKPGEAPAVSFWQGPTVTYEPGKGLNFDGGDDGSLRIRTAAQAKWRWVNNENANDTNGFDIQRARNIIDGHAFSRDITYSFILEYADNTAQVLREGFLDWTFHRGDDDSHIGVRIGQFRLGDSRQFDTDALQLEFAERSLATNTFSARRSRGAMVHGRHLEGGKLAWNFGAVNSDPAAGSAASNEDGNNNGENEVNFIAGVRFDPQGAMPLHEGDLEHSGSVQSSFGASVFIGNDNVAGAAFEQTSININAAIKSGTGLAGQGEVFIRSDDPDAVGGAESDSVGWYVQGSWTAAPGEGTQWAAVGRVSMVDFDDNPNLLTAAGLDGQVGNVLTTAGDTVVIQGGVSAYYHGHDMKTQIIYSFQSNSPDVGLDTDNHGLEVMTTIVL